MGQVYREESTKYFGLLGEASGDKGESQEKMSQNQTFLRLKTKDSTNNKKQEQGRQGCTQKDKYFNVTTININVLSI